MSWTWRKEIEQQPIFSLYTLNSVFYLEQYKEITHNLKLSVYVVLKIIYPFQSIERNCQLQLKISVFLGAD